MVKLKYLKIEKYRNVKPGTTLHFRDSLNVVLGRNGTGKTTLLNLIVQLLSWDFSKLQEEAASLEYRLQTPRLELLVHFQNNAIQAPMAELADTQSLPSEFLALGLTPRNSQSATTLTVTLLPPGEEPRVIHLDGATLTLRTKGSSPHTVHTGKSTIGTKTLTSILSNLIVPDPTELERYAFYALVDIVSPGPQRFDESLSYFNQITEEDSLLAITTDSNRGRFGRNLSYNRNGPIDFAAAIVRAFNTNPEIDDLGISSTDKGQDFLHRVVSLLGFSSVKVRIQRTAKTNGPNTKIDFGKSQYSFTKRDGSVVNHSLLSYGQKRILAFFYYLATFPASVIADELVNGMHHEWIEACLEELGERQAFLTSQNPLLLDYLSFESAEEVHSSFVLCRTEFQENREQLVWENMTPEDSEGFFKAYQVAIQHVSELLRTRGLW